MTGQELYEKYKELRATGEDGVTGIICGYSYEDNLIIAVDAGISGWHNPDNDDVIDICQENFNGYWYVHEDEIIKI